ncbi:hypothetical protein Athai_27880 [Actinocatenispora thailandica]|uniref:Secreted protein n=1 Tax=Actinocatenispora thailandica TaxID=227318 RepID=A0A7R7DPJ8_9ACTN|nr:hypothetical protein [Actinocatenispora thailandica]BCJ35285.1 hypothetical protein Athai_27880 [Actinocatenispora thailandica]
MRRLFWLGLGVAVGAVAVRKISQTAQAYSPQGVAASLQSSAVGALDEVRSFVSDVRASMAEREEQILDAVAAGQDRSARPHG